jgi:hypothetical protein
MPSVSQEFARVVETESKRKANTRIRIAAEGAPR